MTRTRRRIEPLPDREPEPHDPWWWLAAWAAATAITVGGVFYMAAHLLSSG